MLSAQPLVRQESNNLSNIEMTSITFEIPRKKTSIYTSSNILQWLNILAFKLIILFLFQVLNDVIVLLIFVPGYENLYKFVIYIFQHFVNNNYSQYKAINVLSNAMTAFLKAKLFYNRSVYVRTSQLALFVNLGMSELSY